MDWIGCMASTTTSSPAEPPLFLLEKVGDDERIAIARALGVHHLGELGRGAADRLDAELGQLLCHRRLTRERGNVLDQHADDIGGVPAGANMPFHPATRKPGSVSAMVGRSGNCGIRLLLATASRLTLSVPAPIISPDVPR